MDAGAKFASQGHDSDPLPRDRTCAPAGEQLVFLSALLAKSLESCNRTRRAVARHRVCCSRHGAFRDSLLEYLPMSVIDHFPAVVRRTLVLAVLASVVAAAGADWPRFRGPDGRGLAPASHPPIEWNDVAGHSQNIAWKVRLPGRGCSCPLVLGDRVLVTCSDGYRQDQLSLNCYDARDGRRIWQRTLWATGRTMTHPTIAPAAPSPVSDGKRVYVLFSSNDVACYDLAGNLIWLRGLMLDYPNASNSLGMASSLVIAEETVIAKLENDSQSLTVALHAEDGTTRWVVDRPAVASWSTPVLWRAADGNTEVVLQSVRGFTAYDLATGKRRWQFAAGGSAQASVVAADGLLLLPARGVTAVKPRVGRNPEVVWDNNRLRCNTATPLVYQDRVYVLSGTILKCAELATGKLRWQLRLKGRRFSASPVLAGDRLYITGEDGVTHVVDIGGTKGKVVGTGKLGETILATPAVGDNALLIRSHQHLWKIARP